MLGNTFARVHLQHQRSHPSFHCRLLACRLSFYPSRLYSLSQHFVFFQLPYGSRTTGRTLWLFPCVENYLPLLFILFEFFAFLNNFLPKEVILTEINFADNLNKATDTHWISLSESFLSRFTMIEYSILSSLVRKYQIRGNRSIN